MRPSWKLSPGASGTALFIARTLAMDPGVPVEVAALSRELLHEARPSSRSALLQIRLRWLGALVRGVEELLVPGLRRHMVVRKRLVEERMRAELAAGTRQLVVLGAGLDTLAWRLGRDHPEVLRVEVDRAATLEVKRRVYSRREWPGRLELVPAELGRESYRETLARCPAFQPDAPTLVLAEGLTMYLREPAVEALLAQVGSRVAFTFLEPDRRGRLRFETASPLADLWLRAQGESFRWGLSPRALPGFLERVGLRLVACEPAGCVRGEWLAVAERL